MVVAASSASYWVPITAVAAGIAAVFVGWQVWIARRAFQGQTMVQIIQQIQDDEVARKARNKLFEYVYDKEPLPLWELYVRRSEVEPALHVMDTLAILVQQRMVPSRPVMRSWGGLIARLWCASEALVLLRRLVEERDDLWSLFEELAESAIRVERQKSGLGPSWITHRKTKEQLAVLVEEARRELKTQELI
jgi:hypothetical protein